MEAIEDAPRRDPLGTLFRETPDVPQASRPEFQSLVNSLEACCRLASGDVEHSEDASPLVQQLEVLRLAYDPVLERHYENPDQRKADLDQLQAIAVRYRSRARFVSDLALDPPTSSADLARPGAPQDDDYLTLSTVHSSKGLVWQRYFFRLRLPRRRRLR